MHFISFLSLLTISVAVSALSILHYEDVWFLPAILGALALIVVAVDVAKTLRGTK